MDGWKTTFLFGRDLVEFQVGTDLLFPRKHVLWLCQEMATPADDEFDIQREG